MQRAARYTFHATNVPHIKRSLLQVNAKQDYKRHLTVRTGAQIAFLSQHLRIKSSNYRF